MTILQAPPPSAVRTKPAALADAPTTILHRAFGVPAGPVPGPVTEPVRVGESLEAGFPETMLALARAGRAEEAKACHVESYAFARRRPGRLGPVAANIIFSAATGNEARALEMAERHVGWLSHDPANHLGNVQLLAATGLALTAAVRAGQGSRMVVAAHRADLVRLWGAPPDGGWTVRSLAPAVWCVAADLAYQLDCRGVDRDVTRHVARVRALADDRVDLPLQRNVFAGLALPAVAGPEGGGSPDWARCAEHAWASRHAGLEQAGAGRLAKAAASFRQAVLAAAADGDGGGRRAAEFLLAQTLLTMGDSVEAADRFADLAEAEQRAGLEPQWPAETLEWLGTAYVRAGAPRAALASWRDSIGSYHAAGMRTAAARVHWRRGRVEAEAGRPEAALAELDRALKILDAARWRSRRHLTALALDVLDARAEVCAALGEFVSTADDEATGYWRTPGDLEDQDGQPRIDEENT
ncbi:MAG: tetratricopeptide repeat protein [Bifidobacteriaceae bacterium]|jgi:tetratricopeptide (TPR) repeat protein|nr:tetratricopeptide repeat protein [Bifidobacteriaceae bacterium]